MNFTLSATNVAALQQQLKSMFLSNDNEEVKNAAENLEIDGTNDSGDGTQILIDAWEKSQEGNENVTVDGDIDQAEAEKLGLFGFRTEDLKYNAADTGLLRAMLRGLDGGENVAISGEYTEDLAETEKKVKQNLISNNDIPYEITSQLSSDERFTQNDIRILQKYWGNIADSAKNDQFKIDNIGTTTSGTLLGVGINSGFESSQTPEDDSKAAINSLRKTFGLEETGEYDEELATAVKAFQEANGLLVDGIVGPQTEAALEKALMETQTKLDSEEELSEAQQTFATNLEIEKGGGFNNDLLASRGENFVFTTSVNRPISSDNLETDLTINALANLQNGATAEIDNQNQILALPLLPSDFRNAETNIDRQGKDLSIEIGDKTLLIKDFYTKNGENPNEDIAENGYPIIQFAEENGVSQVMNIRDFINGVEPSLVFNPEVLESDVNSITLKNSQNSGTLALPSLGNRFEYNQFARQEESPFVKEDGSKDLKIVFGDKDLVIKDFYNAEEGTEITSELAENGIKYIQLGDGTRISTDDFINRRVIY